jgi:hypothetical protein
LLEKRASLKFKYISFDDTLLQSPRIFQGQPQQVVVAPTTTELNSASASFSDKIGMGEMLGMEALTPIAEGKER